MIRQLSTLRDHTVMGSDIEIGRVHGSHFDDAHWKLRYFIVHPHESLELPLVLVSPHTLRDHDPEAGRLHVSQTRGHLEGSPRTENSLTLHRSHEIAFSRHFGWPAWWEETTPTPQSQCEPALRSTLRGYGVDSLNRYMGTLTDYLIDDETWEIRYLVVKTQGWDTHDWLLVAPSWIVDLGQANHIFTVGLRSEEIANAPRWHPEMPLSREFERGLHAHYGRKGYWVQ